jgi:hypothetical protein
MKPTFALDLTRDTIALLHRNPKGWLSIGEAAFDAPDLEEALDYLRKTALGLSPMGMACKIVLPNSQVLYSEVTAPGPSRNDKRRQIAAALEGRTPYPVEDLVFDWSGKGATVKVAVVARETLAEAEAFATGHRLNPVSFVAIPPDGGFVGEPWFGPTAAAESLLAPGEVVDRDREAVTILSRTLPVANSNVASDGLASVTAIEDSDDVPLPGLDAALNAPLSTEASAPEGRATESVGVPTPEAPAPARPSDDAGPADETAVDPAETALAEALADVAPSSLPKAEGAAPVSPPASPAPEVEEAPFAHVTDATAFPDGDDEVLADRGTKPGAAFPDDIPPAPSTAAIAAFASRRSVASPMTGPVPAAAGMARPAADPLSGGSEPRPGQPIPRPIPPRGSSGLVTAPSIPGTRTKPKARIGGSDTASVSTGPSTVRSPARPGGTFGAAAPPRNRIGVVFTVLVALLLLFLAVIAAWSSFWLSQNGSATEPVDQSALQPVPGVDDEMLADMQDPEGKMGPLPESEGAPVADAAALETEDAPIDLALEDPIPATGDEATVTAETEDAASVASVEVAVSAGPAVTVAAPAETSPTGVATVEPMTKPEPAPDTAAEPAPGTAITTELTAAQPPVEDQDEIFLAAMDAPPPALDALALPAPAAVTDAAPLAPMPPPAFGTVYQFDANGLVKPTPDGILSPEGVFLIAGKPPRVPPSRSEVAAAAALAALPDAGSAVTENPAGSASLVTAPDGVLAEPAPADPAMAGFRPRPRPEGLSTATDDDAALAAESPAAFAGLRPLARPASVLVTAAAAQSAGLGAQGASLAAQAEADIAAAAALEANDPSIVAISRRPQERPRDLSRAVEAAVAAAVRTPDPQPEPGPEPVEVASAAAAVAPAAAAAPAPDLKPEELAEADEPDTAKAAPRIPTKTTVAKQATYKNAINLSKISLIGTYGTDSKRYALVRQASGRYKKVKVGDSIDGGKVQAITATEVRYQKGGKLVTLAMPKA